MSNPYTGNPANPPQGKLVITEPADGVDTESVATVNVPLSQTADFTEMVYEQLQAIVASSWFKQTSGVATQLWAVAGCPVAATVSTVPTFITVGAAGAAPPTILTSQDGLAWTARTAVGTSTTAFAVGIKADGTLAVVLANGASGQNVMTSPDGVTWTLRTSNIALASQLGGVVWSPSLALWCIVGGVGGAAAAATSPDGITWTARTIGTATDQMVSVTWSPSLALFIACGYNTGTNAAEVFTSPDGITWTSRTVPTPQTNKTAAVYWAPAASLAVVIAASGGFIWTSPDGVTWTARGAVQSGVPPLVGSALIHTGRQWLSVGQGSSHQVASSLDGITWANRREMGTGTGLCSISKGYDGTLVSVGPGGLILTGLTAQLT